MSQHSGSVGSIPVCVIFSFINYLALQPRTLLSEHCLPIFFFFGQPVHTILEVGHKMMIFRALLVPGVGSLPLWLTCRI
jgi:hypothetical protein